MKTFKNGGVLVEALDELPNIGKSKRLFLDFETTSGNPKKRSVDPWHNCALLGACITVDNCSNAWYVPASIGNISTWLKQLITNTDMWVNHNIKYDMHVATAAGAMPGIKPIFVCTLATAKLIDSDRITRGGYGLSALSSDWLKEDITRYNDRIKQYLLNIKSKDYGDVPADIMAEYGCQDVLSERKLYHFIDRNMPDESLNVRDMEVQLTRALYDMEQRGVKIDMMKLKKTQLITINEMLMLEAKLHKLVGWSIRPHTNDDCFEFLCNAHGLPVLGRTKSGDPSFDKATLMAYVRTAPENLTEAITMIQHYRELNTLNDLFLTPWQTLAVDDTLHAFYNQSVRTGRMSCKDPNMQQLNSIAKSLIVPRLGYHLLSIDYSQIEFRLIVHYIKNREAIAAYEKDPLTDFHTWVAEMCDIPRKPAKNINFQIGYGGGKKKTLQMLSQNKELMEKTLEKAGGDDALFNELRLQHAETVYNAYHEALPELKITSKQAERVCKSRGFVRTAYGRRRHLPIKFAWRAFNSITQGSAAEVMKDRLVATAPAFEPWIEDLDVHQLACVHDDLLFEVPEAQIGPVTSRLVATMEATRVTFRVPIKAVAGSSNRDWSDCQ